jgi:hypothetical protein
MNNDDTYLILMLRQHAKAIREECTEIDNAKNGVMLSRASLMEDAAIAIEELNLDLIHCQQL